MKQEGLEFPVMRDKDEQTVKIVGMGGSYGTPLTIVLDADGIVRWHGFNATAETAAQVDAVLEELLASFFVAQIPDLLRDLSDYAKGKYASAYKKARRFLADDGASETLKAQSQRVIDNIDAAVERQRVQAEQKRARGRPSAAQDTLDQALTAFKGTPKAEELVALQKAWKTDKAFKAERKAEKELEKVMAKFAKDLPKGRARAAKSARKKLEKLLEVCAGGPLEARVRKALAALD